MKEIVIQVPEGKRAEWINGVLTLVNDDGRDIIERIKTFDDAREYLGSQHLFVREYMHAESMQEASENIKMYLKLRIIATALNEGWKPRYTKEEVRYSLRFTRYEDDEIKDSSEESKKKIVYVNLNGKIQAFRAFYVYEVYKSYGLDLSFKNEKLAKYACKQFANEWIHYFYSLVTA